MSKSRKERRDEIQALLTELGITPGSGGGGTTVTLTGINNIVGTNINEGSSRSYQAFATYSNGTTQEVTTQGVWSATEGTFSGNTLSVNSNGATGDTRSVTITFSFGGFTRSNIFTIFDTTPAGGGTIDSTGIVMETQSNSLTYALEGGDTQHYHYDERGNLIWDYEQTSDFGSTWTDATARGRGIGAKGGPAGKWGFRRKGGVGRFNGLPFPDLTVGNIAGTVYTVTSGNWDTPSVWNTGVVPTTGTSKVQISAGHTIVLNRAVTAIERVYVQEGGTLTFDPAMSVQLILTRNMWVQGNYNMKPSTFSQVHRLTFNGIVETNFIGGGLQPIESDIGLWGTDHFMFDFVGAAKKSWTRATTSVAAGATSMIVEDATGWRVGDVIGICPTDEPGYRQHDYNDSTQQGTDPFYAKFERRTITAITGNTVSWSGGLAHAHNSVTMAGVKTWYAEVANLTRNVVIEGQSFTQRTHTFMHSHMNKPNLRYVEYRNVGPRKIQPQEGGASFSRPSLVAGRYAMHFHHGGDNTQGAIVDGCVVHDSGNRCFVPHLSHGIIIRNCVAWDTAQEAYWWDWQEQTHDCLWQNNLAALCRMNGVDGRTIAFMLNMGDRNVIEDCVAVGAGMGDENAGGAYNWDADSEGVWVMRRNMAHSCTNALWVWQNTTNNHTIDDQEAYNCFLGGLHGAYGNAYLYTRGNYYRAPWRVKAAAANSYGVVFKDIIFDAGGKNESVMVEDSPIGTILTATNKWIGCDFRGWALRPLRLYTQKTAGHPDKNTKHADLINCNLNGGTPVIDISNSTYIPMNGSGFRVQPLSGQAYRIEIQNGVVSTYNIANFLPSFWGTGTGLTGQYFNSNNFTNLAFTREDSMIMFDAWGVDKRFAPFGVDHLVPTGNFSMIWTGFFQPQTTDTYNLKLDHGVGFELYLTVNGTKTLIASSPDIGQDEGKTTSQPVALTQGVKYPIELRAFNNNTGGRRMRLLMYAPSLGYDQTIPQPQLYPS